MISVRERSTVLVEEVSLFAASR